MKPPPPSPDQRSRPRRRLSVWSLLAPAALVAVVMLTFSALGDSCVFKDCGAKEATASDTPAEEALAAKREERPELYTKDGRLKPRWKVREGQSAQNIADDFELTIEELKACNPQILDIRQLQAGEFVQVNHKYCKGAQPADAGAVVDPSAGTPAEVASGADGGKRADQ